MTLLEKTNFVLRKHTMNQLPTHNVIILTLVIVGKYRLQKKKLECFRNLTSKTVSQSLSHV